MSFRARSSSSLRALPFSFWAYTSSVHHPRGEHRQNETSSRKRQNNTVRWRTNFNYHSCFTAMSEQQAILVRKPWLKHNFQAHSKSCYEMKPRIHALMCRLLIPSTSKVSESPHQKQMTCSFSPSKDTRSICWKCTQRLRHFKLR